MRIAILGAGSVGGAFGAALAAVGHSVVFGVRDPGSENCRAALGGAPGLRAQHGRTVGFAISDG